jgi:hypothetical protein
MREADRCHDSGLNQSKIIAIQAAALAQIIFNFRQAQPQADTAFVSDLLYLGSIAASQDSSCIAVEDGKP